VSERRAASPAFAILLPGVFLIHALNYLYFFVDDEGIPFIFARHLLEGKGLVYNSFEGRVEGYSDFLHVLVAALHLLVARALGLGPLAVFFFGKAVSLAAGTATVGLIAATLWRTTSIRAPGFITGTVFLVCAAPLARWSSSSLEMALVTLLITIVTVNIFDGSATRDRLTAIAACLLVLLRIDGFVFVLALVAPAWGLADANRRREMTRNVVLPVAVTLALYHTWRVWYFGHWLPAPLVAKVLPRLRPTPNVVVRAPDTPYILSFLYAYGIVAALITLTFFVLAARQNRKPWSLLASACVLVTYAGVVGDWMSGFRFFLPALPAIAVLLALGVAAISPPRIAWAACIVACISFAAGAVRAATRYDLIDYRESWWAHPSLEPTRYFGPYIELYQAVRPLAPRGTRIAYNQAGFIPFMLDADNVDDLGICSRFVADLPTTDVVFTGVGRYSPLTNGLALRAANAYVLYRAPDLVLAQVENLRSANRGAVPAYLLRGYYTRVSSHTLAAIYRKAKDPAPEFGSSPRAFLENLAHPSRVRFAFDGTVIPTAEYRWRLAFLADRALDRSFAGGLHYDVSFASANEQVYELTVQSVWSRTATTMTLTLWATDGAIVHQDARTLSADHTERIRLVWPDGPRACRFSIAFENTSVTPARVILRDLRVQGQTPELEQYVRQLPFPPQR
jgi:hypothetical protein